MKVLIVNEDRHLINPESSFCEQHCNDIISRYPNDAIIDFTEPIKNLDYRTF